MAFPAAAQTLPSLTVLADSSLALPMTDIVRQYSTTNKIVISASYASSDEQAQQISEGAPADVLITAKPGWVESLRLQGIIDVYTQAELARNRLVLVGPPGSTLRVDVTRSFAYDQLFKPRGDEPVFTVPHPESLVAGGFAMQALRRLDAWQDIEPFTLYPRQSGQMLDMVEHQGAYGITYYSEAATHPNVSVIGDIPSELHEPILYRAVVVAGENMDEARKFLEYLKSEQARQFMRRYGFMVE